MNCGVLVLLLVFNFFMEREKVIILPVFNYSIHFIITDNIQFSRDGRAHILGARDSELTNVDGLHSYNKLRMDAGIFVTPETSIGVIAHEIFHAIWRMFKAIGAKNENEVFAYHLSYLLDEFLKFKNEPPETTS